MRENYREVKEMKTEQSLKDRCTPEFIRWCCEYADGFSFHVHISVDFEATLYYKNESIDFIDMLDYSLFPLLIHRTVEGWNKKDREGYYTIDTVSDSILIMKNKYPMPKPKNYRMKNYQPQNLTPAECACLHCLLDIFEEVGK